MYPYTASGTGLTAVVPPWAQADDKLYDNLRDPAMRAKIRQEMVKPSGDWEAMGSRDPGQRHAHRLSEAGEPALRRQTADRDRGDARPGLDRTVSSTCLLSEEQRIGTIYFP